MNLNCKRHLRAPAAWLFLFAHLCVVQPFQLTVHPTCSFPDLEQPVFRHLQDLTVLLHGQSFPFRTCIFNPTITHLRGDLYLWAARGYAPQDPAHGCTDNLDPRPSLTYDGWRGRNNLMIAVIRTVWNAYGPLKLELAGHGRFEVPMEDPRLFRDADGSPWLLLHYPRAGQMTVTYINVTCAGDGGEGTRCGLTLGGTRLLWYSNAMRIEKNWVPHNGTARMSYPLYPHFAPHSVFDWGTYHFPPVRDRFDSVAPDEPFFAEMVKAYHGLVQFAGSTPAVLHDDGVSYVAFGHMRAHAQCFHDLNNVAAPIPTNCAKLAAFGGRHDLKFFDYIHQGKPYNHHYKEYAMFIYKFKSTAPYEITHMSHSFIPCTAHHSGIAFPAGLDRIGPERHYLVTFGEANRYSRLLTIHKDKLDKLLVPMAELRADVSKYTLCAMPCS